MQGARGEATQATSPCARALELRAGLRAPWLGGWLRAVPFQRLPSSAAGDPGWTRSRPPPRLRRCADLASPPAAERRWVPHPGDLAGAVGRALTASGLAAVVALVVVVVVVVVVAYGVGGPTAPRPAAGHTHGRGSPARSRTSTTATPQSTTMTTTTIPATTTTTTGPGSLPQTTTLPSATTPQFHAEMADLWQGVVTGSTRTAMPAFFPLAAYLQLKSIPDAQGDWQSRLVGELSLDLGAAHALIGSGTATAQLIQVIVPTQYAHWVTPGVCDNSIGYYEVPNARVVYRTKGVVRSSGIASMISWRGQWYVVHLGAVLRTTTSGHGEVDAPATGPGTSAYSSTC